VSGSDKVLAKDKAIVIGVPAYRRADELTVGRLLAMPFRLQRPAWRFVDGTHPDRAPVSKPTRLAA
jgi:hypothetical protein